MGWENIWTKIINLINFFVILNFKNLFWISPGESNDNLFLIYLDYLNSGSSVGFLIYFDY